MDEAQRRPDEYEDLPSDVGDTSDVSGNRDPIPLTDRIRQQIEHGIGEAREQADAGIHKGGEELETAAEHLKDVASEREGQPARIGTKVAERLEITATYLKHHTSNDMLDDVKSYVRQHPKRTLLGAMMAGFVVGRMMH